MAVIANSSLYQPLIDLRYEPPPEFTAKCKQGCLVLTQTEMVAALKNTHQIGKRSVIDAERQRGYLDGFEAGKFRARGKE